MLLTYTEASAEVLEWYVTCETMIAFFCILHSSPFTFPLRSDDL
jgi:hypothetical protein